MRVKLQWGQMFLKLKMKKVKDQEKDMNVGMICIVKMKFVYALNFIHISD